MESLILFRGIQGLGAGALFPISLAVIGDLFTPAERGKYQGLFGAVFGVAAVIGPLLGGFITDSFGWHWIFYVNLPIGMVALYIIGRYLPAIKRSGAHYTLDYLGAAVFTVAISFLLVGLTNKQSGEWTDIERGRLHPRSRWSWACCSSSWRRGPRSRSCPLDLFRNRVYSVSDRGDLPGRLRLLRRDRVPAPLVPVREGRQPHRVGPPDAGPAAGRDPQLDRVGRDHQPHRQVQGPDHRRRSR